MDISYYSQTTNEPEYYSTSSTENDGTVYTIYYWPNYVIYYVMPSTGGFGTWPYTLAGLAICGGAAAILCRRRRRA
ncbi:MAG: LPXTG cell wall anchor domain-containing protein [Clostridiales bacterium]|nr:LPXTG cell wall anchor domain-containing protein [Clostridiales bacterium]